MGEEKRITRRGILAAAGMMGAGAALTRLAGPAWAAAAKEAKMDVWPWPYEKLDPAKTAEIAYSEWYRIYCGGAVVSSIFSQLKEKVGKPYSDFPVDAFIFLEGGMSGWGTICGSNAGANLVTNLIIGPRTCGSEDGMLMGSEMLQWYSDTPMPVFVPKEPKFKGEIIKTTADSPLCHVSVGKWMQAAGKELKSQERRDRCARVTASVAYHLVELLNKWKDDDYETAGEVPSAIFGITAQHNCTDCHGDDVPTPPQPAPAPENKEPVKS